MSYRKRGRHAGLSIDEAKKAIIQRRARGRLIPGTNFYRNFCIVCENPIRVTRKNRYRTTCTCWGCTGSPYTQAKNRG